MKKLLATLAFSAILATPVLALDGQALYNAKGCGGCHGEAGASITPTFPKLAGQHASYIANQAKAIRDGKRNSGMSAMMRPIVAAASDEEIAAIADFLASQ